MWPGWVERCIHMCWCVETWGQPRVLFLSSHLPTFWGRISLWNLVLLIRLSWLATETQTSPCLHFLRGGLTRTCGCAQFWPWVLMFVKQLLYQMNYLVTSSSWFPVSKIWQLSSCWFYIFPPTLVLILWPKTPIFKLQTINGERQNPQNQIYNIPT